MAGPHAWQSFCQNPPSVSKNELAGVASEVPTNNSDTFSHTLAMSRILILAPASLPASANLTARYFEKDFQQIFKTVLEARAPVPASQPLVFLDRPCKRPLKARFPDLYHNKTHMECYNFCQQCKDYFATVGAKEHSRLLFATIFF